MKTLRKIRGAGARPWFAALTLALIFAALCRDAATSAQGATVIYALSNWDQSLPGAPTNAIRVTQVGPIQSDGTYYFAGIPRWLTGTTNGFYTNALGGGNYEAFIQQPVGVFPPIAPVLFQLAMGDTNTYFLPQVQISGGNFFVTRIVNYTNGGTGIPINNFNGQGAGTNNGSFTNTGSFGVGGATTIGGGLAVKGQATFTLQSTFNGFVEMNGGLNVANNSTLAINGVGNLQADGSALTGLNASALTAGTVPAAQLPNLAGGVTGPVTATVVNNVGSAALPAAQITGAVATNNLPAALAALAQNNAVSLTNLNSLYGGVTLAGNGPQAALTTYPTNIYTSTATYSATVNPGGLLANNVLTSSAGGFDVTGTNGLGLGGSITFNGSAQYMVGDVIDSTHAHVFPPFVATYVSLHGLVSPNTVNLHDDTGGNLTGMIDGGGNLWNPIWGNNGLVLVGLKGSNSFRIYDGQQGNAFGQDTFTVQSLYGYKDIFSLSVGAPANSFYMLPDGTISVGQGLTNLSGNLNLLGPVKVLQSLNVAGTGNLTGDGSGLTGIPASSLSAIVTTNNASQLSSGTISPALLPAIATTNNASQLSSGTVPLAQLPAIVTTNNATTISSGTLADARLTPNAALYNAAAGAFTGAKNSFVYSTNSGGLGVGGGAYVQGTTTLSNNAANTDWLDMYSGTGGASSKQFRFWQDGGGSPALSCLNGGSLFFEYRAGGNCYVTGGISMGIDNTSPAFPLDVTGQTRSTAGFISGVTTTPATISVGSSPFTYTAGTINETVYVVGGVVTALTYAGYSVPSAALSTSLIPLGFGYQLNAGQTLVVTYTTAPAMFKHL